jgi:3-oxoacyl-[acyl-carrier-protein] synthase II
VVLTGLGAITPLGHDLLTSFAAARAGASGLRPLPSLRGTPLEGRLGGPVAPQAQRRGVVMITLARAAIREALAESRLAVDPERVALLLGTSMTPDDPLVDRLVAEVRDELGGLVTLVVSTACISSASAIALGRTLLESNAFDAVIAGGADEIASSTVAGFHALGLVNPEAVTPFGAPGGTNVAEGAAFVVLERAADARARGATIVATLLGVGHTSDAFHATSPHPSGDGLTRAALAALEDAALTPSEIGWISAHGTGTRANDESEHLALLGVFGESTARIPVTATKSLMGHALGATSAIELALGVSAMRAGELLPSSPSLVPRECFELELVTSPRPLGRGDDGAAVGGPLLKLGAGFGGLNAALVVGHGATPSRSLRRPRRGSPTVLGIGGFGGGDPSFDPMGSWLDVGEDPSVEGAELDLTSIGRGIQARGMDRSAQLLSAAVHRAAANAGAPSGERTGTFVGRRRPSPETVRQYSASLDERGLLRAHAPSFASTLLSSAAGAVCRAHSLKGASFTLSTGAGSGLAAVVLAADHLLQREDLDQAYAAAVEERDLEAPRAVLDGAAAILLGAPAVTAPEERTVELAGWALGPSPERALAAALERAGLATAEVLTVHHPSRVPAVAGLLAMGVATRRVLAGELPYIAVLERGDLASVCVIVQLRGT